MRISDHQSILSSMHTMSLSHSGLADTLVVTPPAQPEAVDSKPRSIAYDVSGCPAVGPASSCNVSCTPGRLGVGIKIHVVGLELWVSG